MEIKLTEEMFDACAKKAMCKWDEIDKKNDESSKNAMVTLMMGLQNAMFARLIRDEIFNTQED